MDIVKIGLVGLGGMGGTHYRAYAENPMAKVVALCDQDADKLAGGFLNVATNLGAAGSAAGTIDARRHARYEDLLADPEVAVVDICLPTYFHAEVAERAFAAGKAVICEKPLALTGDDAERMVAAARAAGRPLFVGQCLRFWPAYVRLKELVDAGALGRVRQAAFTRLSARPFWSWEGWMADAERSGGAALDLHIHDVDFVQFLFGPPDEVAAHAHLADRNHIVAHYRWKDHPDRLVTAEGGWLYAKSFGFTMQFRVDGEDATATFNWQDSPGLWIHDRKSGEKREEKLNPLGGHRLELEHFVDCLATSRESPTITPESAAAAVRLVERELDSARRGGLFVPAR